MWDPDASEEPMGPSNDCRVFWDTAQEGTGGTRVGLPREPRVCEDSTLCKQLKRSPAVAGFPSPSKPPATTGAAHDAGLAARAASTSADAFSLRNSNRQPKRARARQPFQGSTPDPLSPQAVTDASPNVIRTETSHAPAPGDLEVMESLLARLAHRKAESPRDPENPRGLSKAKKRTGALRDKSGELVNRSTTCVEMTGARGKGNEDEEAAVEITKATASPQLSTVDPPLPSDARSLPPSAGGLAVAGAGKSHTSGPRSPAIPRPSPQKPDRPRVVTTEAAEAASTIQASTLCDASNSPPQPPSSGSTSSGRFSGPALGMRPRRRPMSDASASPVPHFDAKARRSQQQIVTRSQSIATSGSGRAKLPFKPPTPSAKASGPSDGLHHSNGYPSRSSRRSSMPMHTTGAKSINASLPAQQKQVAGLAVAQNGDPQSPADRQVSDASADLGDLLVGLDPSFMDEDVSF